ncbi:MAG: hypothetical protein ACTSW1_02200 [Candidatus Hodarchaeales archaeon]
MGFVSLTLFLLDIPIVLWFIGTFLISPFFSRLPDKDQTIARITFNQVIPHRGKSTHNLIYGLPLIILLFLPNCGIVCQFLSLVIVSTFGAVFAHSLVDALNHAGVWVGIFKIKGFLKWDSLLGNLLVKILGILLIFIPIFQWFLAN